MSFADFIGPIFSSEEKVVPPTNPYGSNIGIMTHDVVEEIKRSMEASRKTAGNYSKKKVLWESNSSDFPEDFFRISGPMSHRGMGQSRVCLGLDSAPPLPPKSESPSNHDETLERYAAKIRSSWAESRQFFWVGRTSLDSPIIEYGENEEGSDEEQEGSEMEEEDSSSSSSSGDSSEEGDEDEEEGSDEDEDSPMEREDVSLDSSLDNFSPNPLFRLLQIINSYLTEIPDDEDKIASLDYIVSILEIVDCDHCLFSVAPRVFCQNPRQLGKSLCNYCEKKRGVVKRHKEIVDLIVQISIRYRGSMVPAEIVVRIRDKYSLRVFEHGVKNDI